MCHIIYIPNLRVDCCARSRRSQPIRRFPTSSALKLEQYNRSYSKLSSVLLQRNKWLRLRRTKKRKHAHVLAVVRGRGNLNAFGNSRQAQL